MVDKSGERLEGWVNADGGHFNSCLKFKLLYRFVFKLIKECISRSSAVIFSRGRPSEQVIKTACQI